jgi:hypothetical protein
MMVKVVIEFLYYFGISMFSRKREAYSKIEIERSLSYSRIIDRIRDDSKYFFCHLKNSVFPS